MRAIFLATLIVFASGSARAINAEEQDHLANVIDSLVIVSGRLKELKSPLDSNIRIWGKNVFKAPSIKTEAAIKISAGIENCRYQLKLFIYSLLSYLEGARIGPCRAIELNQKLLESNTLNVTAVLSIAKSDLGNKFSIKADSAIALLKDALDYINENIPDSCETYSHPLR